MKALFAIVFFLLGFVSFSQPFYRKLSPDLTLLLQQKKVTGRINVLLFVKDAAALKTTTTVNVIRRYRNTALISIDVSQVDSLAKSDNASFISLWRQPKEELTTGALDISLNKIALLHNNYSSVNGDSILVSIKEQSLDTTDIDWKNRYLSTGVAALTESSHASIMATMVAGGANSSPYAKGVAWGSYLTSSDFATLLPDADSVYKHYNVSVQNHSYGTAIEHYYGADAAAFDQSSKINPALLHVFSAGNVGNTSSTDGPYTGLANYANITGSFKMGKNSITVGATDSFNHVALLSSKGPAYDGRVKPDLVAFGEDGSSGAAALVSGTAALVQQAYKRFVKASLPSNALVKAILLNSTDDIERPNADYASGYGALNAFGAVQTVMNSRFWEDSVAQDETKTFSVNIPANTSLAKFTVTWMDAPAAPNATKALVNDLDAELQLPATGKSWLPWVLNPANNIDSVMQPAQRKKDTLNSTEQITVENPAVGAYRLRIKGSHIDSGNKQAFAVAYQFDSSNAFRWTYPMSTDALQATTSQVVRWQTNMRGNASLEYSLDGVQWQTLSTNVNLQDQYYSWQTPDTTSVAMLRMRTSTQSAPVVSDTFSLSNALLLKVGFNCADSFLLFWNSLPVSKYQLYYLGKKYLQPLLTTGDTLAVLKKSQASSLLYGVAPSIQNRLGLRSFATDYTTQGVGCFLSNFLATLQNNKAVLQISLGTAYGIDSIQLIRKNGTGTAVVQAFKPPLQTDFSFEDASLTAGVNAFQLAIKLSNGQTIFSNTELVYFFPKQPVIFYPNPARQNSPIQVIAQFPGEHTIVVYDATGRRLDSRLLEDVSQQLPPFRLAKGIYYITVTDTKGNRFSQKLAVY